MIRKTIIALATAAAAFSTGANAQITNPNGIVGSYNIDVVESLMTELGIGTQQSQASDGTTYLVATIDGVNHVLHPRACEQGVCKGLRLLTIFENSPVNLETANMFNTQHNPTRMIVENSSMIFHRYLIGDYGYARGNFLTNLAVFIQAAPSYRSMINPTANTISFQSLQDAPSAPRNVKPGAPLPTDNVADQLNASQKIVSAQAPQQDAMPLSIKSVIDSSNDPIDINLYADSVVNRFDK